MVKGFVAAAIMAVGMPVAWAETPRFYELEGFGHFLDGNPESTAVNEEGAIILPPTVREWYADTVASYSAAAAWGSQIAVARIDDGQVLAIDRAGKETPLMKADEHLVTAMLATTDGLFVAAGPPARIYKIDRGGQVRLFYAADAAHVWGMAEAGDGIYLVTGEPGTVVKVDRRGNGKRLFAPEQEHLRSVVFDKRLGLFVGGGSHGVVYRSKDGATDLRALFDTAHEEVTAMLVGASYVYVAAVSGADALVANNKSRGQRKEKGGADVQAQLVQVEMDGAARVLAGSNDEAIFDLAFDDVGRVVVATGAAGKEDPRGRLYTVDPGRRVVSMIYQSPSRRLTQLVSLPGKALAAIAAEGGRITHLTGGVAPSGEFLTLPFDAAINAQFGMVQLFGEFPPGTGASVAVRTGQTATPDGSWSPWSPEVPAPGNTAPKVPNGRYAQARITLKSAQNRSPAVYRLRLAYLRQNLPPFVREVVALRKGIALLPLYREEQKSKTISLDDKTRDDLRHDTTAKPTHESKPRARQVMSDGALTVKWVAEDPNGDDLRYDLMIRNAEPPNPWRTLESSLAEPFYTLNATQLPDGHYQFKVRATDRPSNPDGLEKEDTRESRSVLVDNTPPSVDEPTVNMKGGEVTVRAAVHDAVGPLIQATYSLDTGDLRPLLPDDGVLDGPRETFTMRFSQLASGPHAVTIRVVDEAENQGFRQARFVVP